MSNVSCPHCGTANPSNAAYCQRCQRPLGNAKPASQLPSSSQVAQQILQKRPPVPTSAAPQAQPSAAQVAAQIMQRRADNPPPSPIERTVVERVPTAPAAKPAPRPVAPAAQPKSPFTDKTMPDRTATHDFSNEPTAVFQVPKSLHDEPTRNAGSSVIPPAARGETPRATPAVPAGPRPAAAPTLPQPQLSRDVLPAAREPAAKAAPLRSSLEIQERRGVAASVPQRPAPMPPEPTAMDIEYAAGWRLLLSHLVDFALVAGLFVLVAQLDASLSGPRGIETSGVWDWVGSHPGSTLRAAIVTTLLGTAYHIVMAQLSGRTIGRMVAGTTLARRSGKPLNTFVIVVRAVASFASLLMFGAGFFWSIVDRRGRGFHDLVAGTMVVRYHG